MKTILLFLLFPVFGFAQSVSIGLDVSTYAPNRIGADVARYADLGRVSIGLGIAASTDIWTPHIDLKLYGTEKFYAKTGIGYAVTKLDHSWIIPAQFCFDFKHVYFGGGWSVLVVRPDDRPYSQHESNALPSLVFGVRF